MIPTWLRKRGGSTRRGWTNWRINKSNYKKNANIKSEVIVEDEDEESSEEDDGIGLRPQNNKIGQIFDDTIGEYNQKQKELLKLQKQKEATALAKLDIMKAEKAKNKVISSVGEY
jgi:hypothetical protein